MKNRLVLVLLFEGGNILKVYVNENKLVELGESLIPNWCSIPEYILITFITSLLVSVPIWAGAWIFRRVRDILFRRRVAPVRIRNPRHNVPRNIPVQPNIPQNVNANVQPEPQQDQQ